jgi:hypothetical protein
MNTTIPVPKFVLHPDHKLTATEIEDGISDSYIDIEMLKADPTGARRTLDSELEMIAKPIERVRAIASYFGLIEEFRKEMRRFVK